MTPEICKITFPDGAWIKAELPTGDERIEYVLDHFGMFKEISALPETDAAVIAKSGMQLDCRDHAYCCGFADAKQGLGFPNRIYLERRYPNMTSRGAYEEGFNDFIINHVLF